VLFFAMVFISLELFQNENLKIKQCYRVGKNGLALKNTGCSFRGPRFSSQKIKDGELFKEDNDSEDGEEWVASRGA